MKIKLINAWTWAKINRSHIGSSVAVVLAIVFSVLTVVLYYQGKDNTNRLIAKQEISQAQAQADSAKAQIKRIQDAFCGDATDPGLLPTLAGVPTIVTNTDLGRKLIHGSDKASKVIQCNPEKVLLPPEPTASLGPSPH